MNTAIRTFKKLRISLTDTCNLACSYCVPENHVALAQNVRSTLSCGQYLQIVEQLHKKLQFSKVRLTGGEPLMYPHIIDIVAGIKALGIEHIGITTNAYYLKKLAGKLKRAGINSINVSLDAMDEETFAKITRKPLLKQTLQGIEAAMRYGMDVKINSVIMKGTNEHEIIPLLKFGMQHDIPIRFLELMKMGYLHHNFNAHFYAQKEILNQIQQHFPIRRTLRKKASTSNYWEIENKSYQFGIIANESEPFCADCDRLRLDSYGKIYGCISAAKGIDIGRYINKNLDPLIASAMQQKQPVRFQGSEISMRHLGG